MPDNINNSVVAMYDNHSSAEAAIKKLAQAGIPMNRLSVIGKGYHTDEKVVGFYNAGDRIKLWGKYGALWGGLWGMLGGGLYMAVPIIGTVVVLGPFAAVVLAGIEGAAVIGGLGALGAGLYGIGIPKDTIIKYEDAIEADGFMVMIHGDEHEVGHARDILKGGDAKHLDMHLRSKMKEAG